MSRGIIGRLPSERNTGEIPMTDLTRRTLLAGAAAAAATPFAATSSVRAAAPPAGKQVPSYYRYKVGEYELTAILDGVRQVKLDTSPIRNAKLEEVQAVLASSYLPKDQVGYYFHPTLVNTGSKLVLIDTGNGPGSIQAGTGMTPANLAAAGIDPKAIDVVVISHFHGDHISGLRTVDGALAYPNAEIMVPAKEWAYWSDEGNASRAPQGQQATFQNTKRMFGPIAEKITKYEWGKEVAPGHFGDGHQRPHARPYIVRDLLRRGQVSRPGRCHRRLRAADRRQSELAGRRRHGRSAGGSNAAQALRHARGRAHAGLGLSLPVPVARLHREGGQRLPSHTGELESGALRRAVIDVKLKAARQRGGLRA
jgi:hypothetical protein